MGLMHVCPWWLAFLIDNRLRRWLQNPEQILNGHVREAQTVLDLGCGMGFLTLPLARMVGERGRVIAVDLQRGMLNGLQRRAKRAGLLPRITLHQSSPNRLGLEAQVDFALAFAMVHEVVNIPSFFREVAGLLKPGARFLVAEPKRHVSTAQFQQMLEAAREAGLGVQSILSIRWSHAVLLERTALP